MRRRGLAIAALLGLAASIVLGASTLGGRPARGAPAVSLQRASDAYLPRGGPRDVITIMVIGTDARPGESPTRLRGDSIHLLTVNTERRAATILGFPRDSWVNIPGHGSNKITVATNIGGPDLMEATLESLTGIPVDYSLTTSFEGFSRMVDGIGGLEVEVPAAMSDSFSGAFFRPGRTHMSGGEALAFARNRHDTPGGDIGRSENQGRLLIAALRALRADFFEDPGQVLQWVAVGIRNVATDLGLQELTRLGLAATRVKPSRVRNVVVPSSTGSVGAASVVFISPSAGSIYADMRDDGILNR